VSHTPTLQMRHPVGAIWHPVSEFPPSTLIIAVVFRSLSDCSFQVICRSSLSKLFDSRILNPHHLSCVPFLFFFFHGWRDALYTFASPIQARFGRLNPTKPQPYGFWLIVLIFPLLFPTGSFSHLSPPRPNSSLFTLLSMGVDQLGATSTYLYTW